MTGEVLKDHYDMGKLIAAICAGKFMIIYYDSSKGDIKRDICFFKDLLYSKLMGSALAKT